MIHKFSHISLEYNLIHAYCLSILIVKQIIAKLLHSFECSFLMQCKDKNYNALLRAIQISLVQVALKEFGMILA